MEGEQEQSTVSEGAEQMPCSSTAEPEAQIEDSHAGDPSETHGKTLEEERESTIEGVADFLWLTRKANKLFDGRYSRFVGEDRRHLEFIGYERKALELLKILLSPYPEFIKTYDITKMAQAVAHRLEAKWAVERKAA